MHIFNIALGKYFPEFCYLFHESNKKLKIKKKEAKDDV